MLLFYLKTTLRYLAKEQYYAIIKMAGLALGLGTSLTLLLYVLHQFTFDTSHPDADRLFRLNQTNIWNPAGGFFGSTGPAVSFDLLEDYPEIEQVMRVNTPGQNIVRYTTPEGNILAFHESNVLAADSNFFSFFDFPLKEGDPNTALQGIGKVVLSEQAAQKLFGKNSALGKIILIGDGRHAAVVTGVTAKQPDNIHFHFDYLISIYTNPYIKEFEWSWIWTQVVTYVKLRPGVDVAAFNEKLQTFSNRHVPRTFEKLNMDYKQFMAERGSWQMYLQPVADVHLYSSAIGNRLGAVGDITFVSVLAVVAFIILLIAVVNFINLSTARAAQRAKEVGVKKAMGVQRGALIYQFQMESIFMTMIAMVLAVVIMQLIRIIIPYVIGINIPIHVMSPWALTGLLVLFSLLVGFLAGLYPSLYLTAFKPASVLKGRVSLGLKSSALRNSLVTFQFVVSLVLIMATIVVYQQLDYFQNKDLGLSPDRLLMIQHADKLGTHATSFRDKLATQQGVETVSASMDIRQGFEDIFSPEGVDKKVSLSMYKVDEHFVATLGLSIKAGRNFDQQRPSDKNAVLLNETAARLLGWTPDVAVGKRVAYLGDDVGTQEVIGVLNDFHLQSLHENITPVIFFNVASTIWGEDNLILVRYTSAKTLPSIIAFAEAQWRERINDAPFSYTLYRDELKMQYQHEQQAGILFSMFTVLSVFISMIGLVGLMTFAAEQRRKEIGIRKVFGASITRIFVMMNKSYLRLLLLASLIAAPLGWWLMQQWLNTFAYRISLDASVFVGATCLQAFIALACVGLQAYRAATLNPAMVLKDE